MSSVDLILLYKTQSSAKSLTVDPVEMTSGKSLMKSRNNRGPSTLPWGTPDWTGAEADVCSGGHFKIFPLYKVNTEGDFLRRRKETLLINILKPSLNDK